MLPSRDDELVNFSLAGADRDLPLSEHISLDDVGNMQVAHTPGTHFVHVVVDSWLAALPPPAPDAGSIAGL